MAGVRSAELKENAFGSPVKYAELRALLAAYEAFLLQTKRGDMALVYEEAARHPDWSPMMSEDCWTELPDVVWAPLQRSLIERMSPGERITPRTLSIPGATTPRRLSDRRATSVAPDSALRRLCICYARRNAHPVLAGNSGSPRREFAARAIHLFHAGGRQAEIEEVFRRILATGAPLDQVEIACASDAHVSLVWEKALRHDGRLRSGPAFPRRETRPGRALIGLCDWIETDFSAGVFSSSAAVRRHGPGARGRRIHRCAGCTDSWPRGRWLGTGHGPRSHSGGCARPMCRVRRIPDESDDDRADAQAKADLTARVREWIAVS